MGTKRIIRTLKELEKNLKDTIRGCSRPLAILGGHFPLEVFGNEVVPAVESDDIFGIFPEYTMELASDLIDFGKSKRKNCKLLLVVDDHSQMQDPEWYLHTGEPLADKIDQGVKDYFDSFKLPEKYKGIIDEIGLSEQDFIVSPQGIAAFQESIFRKGMPGGKGCAIEYRGILEEIARQGYKQIISFVPIRCQGPTCQAISKNTIQDLIATQVYLVTEREIDNKRSLEKAMQNLGGIQIIREG